MTLASHTLTTDIETTDDISWQWPKANFAIRLKLTGFWTIWSMFSNLKSAKTQAHSDIVPWSNTFSTLEICNGGCGVVNFSEIWYCRKCLQILVRVCREITSCSCLFIFPLQLFVLLKRIIKKLIHLLWKTCGWLKSNTAVCRDIKGQKCNTNI